MPLWFVVDLVVSAIIRVGAVSVVITSCIVVRFDWWLRVRSAVIATCGGCDCGWVMLSMCIGIVCIALARMAMSTAAWVDVELVPAWVVSAWSSSFLLGECWRCVVVFGCLCPVVGVVAAAVGARRAAVGVWAWGGLRAGGCCSAGKWKLVAYRGLVAGCTGAVVWLGCGCTCE